MAEDEKERHDLTKSYLDLVLSFINPKLFKDYSKISDPKNELINEDFDNEIRSKLGMSKDQLYNLADNTETYHVEEIPSDIIGQPIVIR